MADAPKEHAVVQAALLHAEGPRLVPVERDAAQGHLSPAESHGDIDMRCLHLRGAMHVGSVFRQGQGPVEGPLRLVLQGLVGGQRRAPPGPGLPGAHEGL